MQGMTHVTPAFIFALLTFPSESGIFFHRQYTKENPHELYLPANYFPDDDDTQEPIMRWRGHAHLLFSNWLNYFVYQTTPYDIMTIGQDEEEM